MVTRQDLRIRQGETWAYVYTKRNADGSPFDLTGYTARMGIRPCHDGSSEAYLSTGADADGGSISLGDAAGTVTLSMTATESAVLGGAADLFAPERPASPKTDLVWVYDLELVSAAGAVTRELQGKVWIEREVTR